MKKVIIFLCTAVIAAGAFSCGSDKSSSSDTSISDSKSSNSSDRETPDTLPDDYLDILENMLRHTIRAARITLDRHFRMILSVQ